MRNLRDLRLFAFLMGLSAALFTFKVYAGPGHDDSSVQVQGDAPKRQADGNLFVPKASKFPKIQIKVENFVCTKITSIH